MSSALVAEISPREKARFLEAARVGGLWYLHNQNSPERPWGGVDGSADSGRFLYEYFPATGYSRGCGIWSQGLASAALLQLSKTPVEPAEDFAKAAELGMGYLFSLQIYDSRLPKSIGAFREHTPQTAWGSCRDGASGCFALATFHKLTGKAEYLERARDYCRWYRAHGSDEGGWPQRFFHHDRAESTQDVPGDWQAGGALCYYYTARAGGDREWLDAGFKPVLDRLLEIGAPRDVDGVDTGWHGESRVTVGNDDFATVALMAGFRAFEDERYLALARERVKWMASMQDADGSFPNSGGTFVTALTLLDFVELAAERGLKDDVGPLSAAVLRAARFGLGLQCGEHRDLKAYGGFFGQSNYGVGRDRIHNRSTTYAMHFYLRLAGCQAPCLSAMGW